jgi:CBS-domain-containing membrane protein
MKTSKSLTLLTAEDLMSADVVVISQDTPLREAACLLAHSHISGAPVVDDRGRCVGMLSATDFVRWASETGAVDPPPPDSWPRFCSDWQLVNLEALPSNAVRHYMSADLVTAQPECTITELALRMLDAHIHRIVVLDEERRPLGLVTSTDILAAVAHGSPADSGCETGLAASPR